MSKEINVGIDLGTTFSAAARVNESGQPEIIVNQAQNDSVNLPSVVYYESDTSIVVGEAALSESEIYPDKTIRFAKRYIGEEYDSHRPSGVPASETPVKFQAKILGAIKKYVEEHENGYKINGAVITVPAYFNFNKKNLTRDAAKIAGIEVLGIISEPMAAAIYYCDNQTVEDQTFLVYDLGGGTFDSVIIKYHVVDGVTEIRTLASDGNHQLGGYDWDRCLEQYLFEQAVIEARSKNIELPERISDLEPDDRQALFQKATDLKISLSRNPSRVANFKIEGIPFSITVTSEIFEQETRMHLEETGNKITSVLTQAGLTEDDIDIVLLVGGSTFMPMVQDYVRGRFGADKVRLNTPNLAVAYGAAIYAEALGLGSIIDGDDKDRHKEPGEIPADGTSDDDEGWGVKDGGENKRSVVSGDLGYSHARIVEQASHSVGVRVVIGGQTFVNNLIFKGDSFTAEEPLVVIEDKFTCMGDGSFSAAFYENVRMARFVKDINEYHTIEEFLSDNKDALIAVIRNEDAMSEDEAFIPLDNSDELTYLGELPFTDERISAGDNIIVTLTANQNGIYAHVKHATIPSIEGEIRFDNKDSMTEAEVDEAAKEQEKISIALD